MNFQQIEYVEAVHRHQHFGKAADSCGVTQATLSGMIKRLEIELGILLFDRTKHPIKTTDHGLAFLALGHKILAHKNEIHQLKQTEHTPLEGNLKLGVIPTVANTLLPLILPRIIKENPKLQLTISEITTEQIVRQLDSDRIDLGLLATPLDRPFPEEGILYYEAMMVYGIRDKRTRYISSEDVMNKNVWLLEEGHCFRNQTLKVCQIKAKDISPSKLVFEGSSFDTLLNLTDQFGGLTLIPELYYEQLPLRRKRKTKPFYAPFPVREISLVSSRPYVKNFARSYLSELIKKVVCPKLTSSKHKSKDLEIIGMY